jgi:hypothetical protein
MAVSSVTIAATPSGPESQTITVPAGTASDRNDSKQSSGSVYRVDNADYQISPMEARVGL